MKELQFQVEIQAPKDRVWDTLWQDATFRQWAGIIDPGTHLVGDLIEGNEVQFISGNGYGVTSLVEKLIESELLVFKHRADTKESGAQERADEWTGGRESYELSEENHTTKLTATFDVPEEMENYFRDTYPKALEQVKILAENY